MSSPPALRAVTHNVWVGQPAERLHDNLSRLAHRTRQPHVIAVQEAERLRRPIDGYRLLRADLQVDRPEAGMCKLLVRMDVGVRRLRILQVPLDPPRWQGPKHDLWHPPRIYVGGVLEVEQPDNVWEVLCGHRVPMGDTRNREAYATEGRMLDDWLTKRHERHPYRPIAALFDWNSGAGANGPHDPARLAAGHGGRLAMRDVDGALLIGARATRCNQLESHYGSDNHQPVLVEARR